MKDFSAYHISSRGLKYALAHSAFGQGEVGEADYKKALLNVLSAQDFDSIPLVESYGGPITAIGRRRLHDGDLDDVFILSTEEVSKLPQTAPVIRCIFEVLSNEHHIVFLTDEDDVITDVVTISMLTSPLIQEYLTLLMSKLTSEGWNFNEQHLNSAFVPTYDYPKIIHEELKKLGELVDHPLGVIPSDFDVSKQIVHILSLLQPLKLWEGGQGSEALTSTDYPLKIVTPDYKPGTAGYFAQHPFGAVSEDGIEELAFRLFSEANNWDRVLLHSKNGQNSYVMGIDGTSQKLNKFEVINYVVEDRTMQELVQLVGTGEQPILVKFRNSKYPGIITPQDIIYSEFNKNGMLSSLLKLEICVRDSLLHLLSNEDIASSNTDYFVRSGPVWKGQITTVYARLLSKSPEDVLPFDNKQFHRIMRLRNSMAHNDFSLTANDEADPKKTREYLEFLQHDASKIEEFVDDYEKIGVKYSEFSKIFSQEFNELKITEETYLGKIKSSDFNRCFTHLSHSNGVFNLYFDDRKVVLKAERVRVVLESRNLPWKCRIYHWPSDSSGQEIENQILNEKAMKDAEAKKDAEKQESESKAIIEKIVDDMPSVLKKNIQDMVAREVDEHGLIESNLFRERFRSIIQQTKNDFGFKENQFFLDAGLTQSSLKKGTGGVLTWSGFEYTVQKEENPDGQIKKYFRLNP